MLTDQQKESLNRYREEVWFPYLTAEDPDDKVLEVFDRVYKFCNPNPKHLTNGVVRREIVDSIDVGINRVKQEIQNDSKKVDRSPQFYSAIWWCSWASYWEWALENKIKGVTKTPEFEIYRDWCRYVPYTITNGISKDTEDTDDTVVYICRKPRYIKRNAEDRLHCVDGPAFEWRDGTGMYIIDQVYLNEKIVMRPHEITVKEIEEERNEDVRAIMIDRLGWDRYIQMSNAKLLDTRDNVIENTVEALYQTKYGRRFIANCPSAKNSGIITLGVPNRINTCEEATEYFKPKKGIKLIGRT